MTAESDKFVLCQDHLFFALNTAVRQISLQNSQAGAERVYSGEEPISWLCVRTVRERRWVVVSLPSRTVLECEGQVLSQIPTLGPGSDW